MRTKPTIFAISGRMSFLNSLQPKPSCEESGEALFAITYPGE